MNMKIKAISDEVLNILNQFYETLRVYNEINLLDLNLLSEDFFCKFLNKVFKYNLININKTMKNCPGIDLVDDSNKIIIQITSTNTAKKISDTLENSILSKFSDYNLKFLFLTNEEKSFKKKFKIPVSIKFNIKSDIIKKSQIIAQILSLTIQEAEEIRDFVRAELVNIQPPVNETLMADIVNTLSTVDVVKYNSQSKTPFEIDSKISFNKLGSLSEFISRFSIYHYILEKIYSIYTIQGINKSKRVLDYIYITYTEITLDKNLTEDKIYFELIKRISKFVEESNKYVTISKEEIKTNVTAIVTDAFIRCTIYKNPEENYVTT